MCSTATWRCTCPRDARLALAVRGNDFVFPYFGPGISRHVTLVRPGEAVPADAEWLRHQPVHACQSLPDAWRREFAREPRWRNFRLERRIAPDDCLSD